MAEPVLDHTFTFHGPVFRRPMPAHIRSGISKGIGDLLSEGENLVIKALHEEGPYDGKPTTPGGNVRRLTGHYQRSINGKKTGTLSGKIHDSNMVYGPWLEGVSDRNQTTRFKGYFAFRRAKTALVKKFDRIMGRRISEAVQKMNGGF